MSDIERGSQLDELYRLAEYVVNDGDLRFTIRPGAVNRDLDEMLADRGAGSWAFVTAYNPHSSATSDAENAARQADLIADIKELGHTYLNGYGTGPGWPAEPSVLIIGIPRQTAINLAAHYRQNAILYGEPTHPAELVWCNAGKFTTENTECTES